MDINTTLTVLDGVIAVIVLFFAIRGFMRGFVTEIFSLLSVVIGFVFTTNADVHTWAANLAGSVISEPGWIKIIAYLLVFVVVWAVINLIGKALRKVFQALGSVLLDCSLGFVAGALKGVLLISLLLACMQFLNVGERMRQESVLTHYVNAVWQQLDSMTSGFQRLPDFTARKPQRS